MVINKEDVLMNETDFGIGIQVPVSPSFEQNNISYAYVIRIFHFNSYVLRYLKFQHSMLNAVITSL